MTGLRVTALLAVVGLAAAVLAHTLALRVLVSDLETQLDRSLILSARAVEAEIERFRALPDVASEDARIKAAVARPDDPAAIDAANRYLESVVRHSGAAQLFLLDQNGQARAASNFATPESLVGEVYAFRPYFQQALATGRGTYYAIGVTTGRPGYFHSIRMADAGAGPGVLVVKIELEALQEAWRSAEQGTALIDRDGVVFLSGVPEWLYRPMQPLGLQALARMAAERTYAGVALDKAAPLLQGGVLLAADGGALRHRSTDLARDGWQLIAATDLAPAQALARLWALGAALVAALLTGIAKIWHQRHELTQLRLRQSAELEARVAERTADLAREVQARRQAETDLRAAQEHLIHTEKMAALGRMSTAIVHEMSQPLAAMEATLTAAELTLPPDEKTVAPRLATARGLIRRMQRTTKHLKSFGRKEAGALSLIDLGDVVASALELVTPRARAVGVTPAFAGGHAQVMAGAVRMEQVLVNLLINALDAVEGRAGAQIDVTLSIESGSDGPSRAVLCVADTGQGIAPDDLPRVAEPFFSTKISGEGLGLGLSISRAILADFGGDLSVDSALGQGTSVTVTLPLAYERLEAAQ